jgi:aspartokinase-like uncharacterized kinase
VPDAELVASSLDPRVESANAPRVCILDPLPFFQEDESRPDPLPHAWHVTSDSLAVRAAKLLRARELILLKSIVFDGVNWQAASERGVVDRYFVQALAQLSEAMRVRIACLRDD